VNTQIKVGDTCEKCGWPMTEQEDGTPMHCGRKYYRNDYAFCLEKQNDKAQQENKQLKDRIKRLEEAGDEMANAYEEICHDSYDQKKIANWRKAREAKL
jgi:hypothetical protein